MLLHPGCLSLAASPRGTNDHEKDAHTTSRHHPSASRLASNFRGCRFHWNHAKDLLGRRLCGKRATTWLLLRRLHSYRVRTSRSCSELFCVNWCMT